MSQPFRPSALQRRILASLLHLIRTESSRLRALGVTVAPTVTVSDIYTDLAGDRGRSPPIQKVIADELTAVPGVEKVKPNIEITDAVWSMMNTLPPPRVAGEPAPPPPPPPPAHECPRQAGESSVQLLHRLLGLHPEGLTVRQMRLLSGCDLASVASNEKTAGRVAWERAEGSGAITYKPRLVAPPEVAEQLDQVRAEAEPSPAEHVWIVEPEDADDVRPDVVPVEDASPTTGPATAEGGDTSAVVVVASEHIYGLQSDDDTASSLGEPAGPAPAPHQVPAPDDVREPCPPLKIYVATSLDHAPRAVAVHKALEHAGHIITYRWTDHGSVQDQGVARLREVAEAELNGVRDADVLVAILPGGRGTHAEIGIAIGLGLPVVLLEQVGAYDAECAFYHAPTVSRYMWEDEAVLPLLSFWAEHAWRASVDPNAPLSVPALIRLVNNDLGDHVDALDQIRATCTGAGISGETTDEATGTKTWWPTATLVRRLAEREAATQDKLDDALIEQDQLRNYVQAHSNTAQLAQDILAHADLVLPIGAEAHPLIRAARSAAARITELEELTHLARHILPVCDTPRTVSTDPGLLRDEAEVRHHTDTLIQGAVRAYDMEIRLAQRIAELEAAAAVDHQHRFGLQVRIEELDKELNEVRANAQAKIAELGLATTEAGALAKNRKLRIAELERNMLPPGLGEARLRTELVAALGLSNDRPWSWDQLLVEALAVHEERNEARRKADAERLDFAKAVCTAWGDPLRSVDDCTPDLARTLVLGWLSDSARYYASAKTERNANLDAFRAFVGDVAAAVGISDHDRTENPARTSVAVLEALQARLRPDQEAEIRETARLMGEVEDRLRELVPGYSAPWACVVAINELAKKADAVDDARQILMDALDADTSPASLRSFPGEAAILGVARMAAAQLRHHRLPLAEQLAACRAALTDRINALDLAADLLGVA